MDLWPCMPKEIELMDLDKNNEAGNHYLILSAATKAEKEEQVYYYHQITLCNTL